jgi:hypothetical protein
VLKDIILKSLEISVCGIRDSNLLQPQHGQLNSVSGMFVSQTVTLGLQDPRFTSRVRCMDDERLNMKCVGSLEGFIAI